MCTKEINFPISFISHQIRSQNQRELCTTCTTISQPCRSNCAICRNKRHEVYVILIPCTGPTIFQPNSFPRMSTSNILMEMNTTKSELDERVQIVGRIFQSVGICAVVWGADALLHHGISTLKQVLKSPFIQHQHNLKSREMTFLSRMRTSFAQPKP